MSKIFRVLWIFAGASTLPLSEAVAAQNQTILTNHPVELRETISPQGFVHPGRLVEGESIRQISSGHSGDSCRVLRGREPLDPADPASARGNGVVPGCEPLLLSPTATSWRLPPRIRCSRLPRHRGRNRQPHCPTIRLPI